MSSSSPPQQQQQPIISSSLSNSLNNNNNNSLNNNSTSILQQQQSSSNSYYTSPLNSPQQQSQQLNNNLNNNNNTLINFTNNLNNNNLLQSFQSPISSNNLNSNSNLDNFDVIGFSKEELKSIDQTFSIGAMNAFGMKQSENEILNLIDQISTLQVRSFLGSMEIELKHQNLLNNNNFDNFQSVSQLFQEKEKSISNLVKDLKIITRSINDINQKIHQSNNNNNNN